MLGFLVVELEPAAANAGRATAPKSVEKRILSGAAVLVLRNHRVLLILEFSFSIPNKIEPAQQQLIMEMREKEIEREKKSPPQLFKLSSCTGRPWKVGA